MYITQVIIIKKLDIILPNTGVSNLMRLYKNKQYPNSKMEFLKRFWGSDFQILIAIPIADINTMITV